MPKLQWCTARPLHQQQQQFIETFLQALHTSGMLSVHQHSQLLWLLIPLIFNNDVSSCMPDSKHSVLKWNVMGGLEPKQTLGSSSSPDRLYGSLEIDHKGVLQSISVENDW